MYLDLRRLRMKYSGGLGAASPSSASSMVSSPLQELDLDAGERTPRGGSPSDQMYLTEFETRSDGLPSPMLKLHDFSDARTEIRFVRLIVHLTLFYFHRIRGLNGKKLFF